MSLRRIRHHLRQAAARRREAAVERLVGDALAGVADDDRAAQETAVRHALGMPPGHPETFTGQLTHADEAVINAYEADLLTGACVEEPR